MIKHVATVQISIARGHGFPPLSAAENNAIFIFYIPSFILWIKNLIICFSNDSVPQRVFIVLFNVFYNPFYFLRALKKGWIKNGTIEHDNKSENSTENTDIPRHAVNGQNKIVTKTGKVFHYMKMVIYWICFIANITLIVLMIKQNIKIHISIARGDGLPSQSIVELIVMGISIFLSFILWIRNIIVCFSNDSVPQRVFIVLFHFAYSPFYFLRTLKKGWTK